MPSPPLPEAIEKALTLWANALATFSDSREAAVDDLRRAIAAELRQAMADGITIGARNPVRKRRRNLSTIEAAALEAGEADTK